MKDPDGAQWVVRQLGVIPVEADAALILRHAEREDIPPGTFGDDIPLTANGLASAGRLGATLSRMRPHIRATASPIQRCEATARAILVGGNRSEEVALDRRLGAPGPFVVDTEVVGELFLEIGALEIVRRQLDDADPPKGMRATSEGVELLIGLATNHLQPRGRLSIYVTHDSILAVIVSYLFGVSVDDISWPGYLDGLLLWRCSQRLYFAWSGLEQGSQPIGG